MSHLISESSLKRFACGTASREEGKVILAHLLRGCSSCSRQLQALVDPPEQTASARTLGPVLVGLGRPRAHRPRGSELI